MTRSISLLVLAVIGLGVSGAAAQALMVASPAVVIDDRTRTGEMTLVNDGLEPVEASVGTFYGYPVTDSLGGMYLRTFEAVDDTMPSAATWVQSFPRRLKIPPKSRATVRLLVRPPPGLAPGEYWARVVVAARQGTIPVASPPGRSDIQASLQLEVRSVVGLFYRVGAPTTGVALHDLHAAQVGDSVIGRLGLTRLGNAAFVGSLHLRLIDAEDRVRAELTLPLGVYYRLDPRFAFPVSGLPAGRYRLSVQAASRRPDLPAALMLSAPPADTSLEIVLR